MASTTLLRAEVSPVRITLPQSRNEVERRIGVKKIGPIISPENGCIAKIMEQWTARPCMYPSRTVSILIAASCQK